MWRNRKFIIISVFVVIVLAATLGGVAVAQANDQTSSATATSQNTTSTLFDKVAEIYQTNTGTAIDPQELKNAFEQAGQEIRTDALDSFLQKLVDEGKITQDQADQWKTWLDARPDIPAFNGANSNGGKGFGMMRGDRGWCGGMPDSSTSK